MEPIESWLGQTLPEPYRSFLQGALESEMHGDCVLLYGQDSFIERNETYEAKEYCPGWVTIGDDSGGTQILLSLEGGRLRYVDAGSMAVAESHPLADDFSSWLDAGCPPR